MLSFGPIPSRRLGRSLGINNIPPKHCTYACVYCQVGRTLNMTVERQAFYSPDVLAADVDQKIAEAVRKGEPVDYATFVPDGEPTLDVHLGEHINRVRAMGLKVAVITNASLLWRQDVRDDLACADRVSVKVDAVSEDIWRALNRPHKHLELARMLDGIRRFNRDYRGVMTTETMVVKHVNDHDGEACRVADFIRLLSVRKSYLSVPTRPPAENGVEPPDEDALNRIYYVFTDRGLPVELLIGYEGNAFASTGDISRDVLSIAAVHPIREEALRRMLQDKGQHWDMIQKLLESGRLVQTRYRNRSFFVRPLQRK